MGDYRFWLAEDLYRIPCLVGSHITQDGFINVGGGSQTKDICLNMFLLWQPSSGRISQTDFSDQIKFMLINYSTAS